MQHGYLHHCNALSISAIANSFYMDAGLEADQQLVKELCEWAKLKPSALAKRAKLAATTITRPFNGEATTRISSPTIEKLQAAFPRFPRWAKPEADLPVAPDLIAYVPIEIMPTYAGMGGGGSGEGDIERALVPRYLIESVFRGKQSDFVIIRTRGDSMFPDFNHDDEILVDKRDRNPVQPGPFAVWDAEDEAYVVKNIEKVDGGQFRIFSTNEKYTPRIISREETHIIGRPVWYGRRL
jgi:phage repressor protein C with HTH and peptisase S24 domain